MEFSFQNDRLREARVVRVDERGVWVDIGSKFDSLIPLDEWMKWPWLAEEPSVGDRCFVVVDDDESDLDIDDRPLRVSPGVRVEPRNPLIRELFASTKPGDIHTGTVSQVVDGGFLINIGFPVFLPMNRAPESARLNGETYRGFTGAWRIVTVDVDARRIDVEPA